MSGTDVEKYRSLVEESAKLSDVVRKNYAAVGEMMEKINSMQQISSDKIQQLSTLANSVAQASNSLTDERTLTGLKHLEAIVKK
jgi:ABC-type transporter Mla subunit MlaD